ncbi:hypothetical protein HPG69_006612 [Diceros bicornis minor]|uniref:Uncharacterized protein n=1 Tax=Diceros bicornis minor TaxID=77932 RepID=A0A7J7F613_DICBM|nr:hypothetical protein HPG69_006612 [Diceros bicornis minor]
MFYEELHTWMKKLDISWMKVNTSGLANFYFYAMKLLVRELAWTAYNQSADHFDVLGEYLKFLIQKA